VGIGLAVDGVGYRRCRRQWPSAREARGGSRWQRCSAAGDGRDFRDRQRDNEIDTLAQFDRIARYLEEQAGIEAPIPPELGDVNHEVILS